MHPRNPYINSLNFEELSSQYPELSKYTSKKTNGKIIFDFKDRNGLRSLTKILLKKDFDLKVEIPENALVPTLPLRLNYVLWIEDLMQSVSDTTDVAKVKITGIDIGTGTTCIYPLLMAKKNGWKMIGTDIKTDVINAAVNNVRKNGLDHLISVMKMSSLSSLLESTLDENYDFCVCNPPFFDNDEQESPLPKKRNRAERLQVAKQQVSGTLNEISSPGGEVAFIEQIIEDSLKLQNRIKIYTTMIGRKSSVLPVKEVLKKKGINSFCETQFCQGRTMRWAIAWTFTDVSLRSGMPVLAPKKKAPSKPLTWIFRTESFFEECVNKMEEIFGKLQVRFELCKKSKNITTWKILASRNTWTGLRRARREQQRKEKIISDVGVEEESNSVTTFDEKEDSKYDKNSEKLNIVGVCDSLVLEAEIEMKRLYQREDGNISIRIDFLKGQKESCHQILQYFKNNFV